MYLGAPFVSIVLKRFPHYGRFLQYSGFALMVVALVSSSFASKVWHLILTQVCLFRALFPGLAPYHQSMDDFLIAHV